MAKIELRSDQKRLIAHCAIYVLGYVGGAITFSAAFSTMAGWGWEYVVTNIAALTLVSAAVLLKAIGWAENNYK